MTPADTLSPLDAEASARLIGAADADEFGRALLEIAHAVAGVDELFAYMVLDGKEPDVLISQSRLPGVETRVQLYAQRFYRHDPAVHAIRNTAPGDSFVQRISLSSILPHDYRKHCFVDPGFSEKLSFGWRGERYLMVVSFYSANAPRPASRKTRPQTSRTRGRDASVPGKLASLASMTLAVLVRQYAPLPQANPADTVERRLRRAFPALSKREAEVCARTILGWSSQRIAAEIGVVAGTVLTYRRRAYQKTGVSAAAQLVAEILD